MEATETVKAKSTSKSKRKKEKAEEASEKKRPELTVKFSYVSAGDHSEIHSFKTVEQLLSHYEESHNIAYGKNGYIISIDEIKIFIPMDSMEKAQHLGSMADSFVLKNEEGKELDMLSILSELG